jgi:hypothetical protein
MILSDIIIPSMPSTLELLREILAVLVPYWEIIALILRVIGVIGIVSSSLVLLWYYLKYRK